MYFLLQSDDVSQVEKRLIRQAAALDDYRIMQASLESVHSNMLSPSVSVEMTPVGSVEFIQTFAKSYGVTLPPTSGYPEKLSGFLHRHVRAGVLAEAKDMEFVKPLNQVKKFTGDIKGTLLREMELPPDEPVWIADPVLFLSEWRYYIVDQEIVGVGRYDDGEENAPVPSLDEVSHALQKMNADEQSPRAYALDFGVLSTGQSALVEMNDGWALGYYKGTCSPRDYARLLASRWQEIVSKKKLTPAFS